MTPTQFSDTKGPPVETILEAIGHTPLIRLRRSVPSGHAQIYAKLERFNPGGSLKDRIILKMITEAERRGKIRPGDTLVAGTTGNSGIALAYMGAVKKYKVLLAMPENFSLERRKMLEGYGAEVHLTPVANGLQGALSEARELAQKRKAFFIAQFERPETMEAHRETTAPEIESALAGPIHAVVLGAGTGGSLMGVGGYFKKKGARLIAVEPAASPFLTEGRSGLHRIEGTGPGFLPPILDKRLLDEILLVTDQEAFEGAREVAQKEGILVGISSGAAFVAAKRIADPLGPEKTVLTLFPDGGERYISVKMKQERKS